MDDSFVSKMNKFVFQAALPALVFHDLATVDFFEVWDTRFVVFCFTATLASILGVSALSCLWSDKSIRGEFIQAAYRSSAAILGIAFIQNIYGNSGMAPLMIVATVPLYNMMAVVVLSVFKNASGVLAAAWSNAEHSSTDHACDPPEALSWKEMGVSSSFKMKPQRGNMNRQLMIKTGKGIITNPIILGIAAGILWSLLKLPMPAILEKTVKNVSSLASPMGLMAMGASFEMGQASAKLKPAVAASAIKLVVLAAVFLPIAVHLGFTQEKLVAILIMLGSATTVSSYIMARNMGHEGVLTSSTVMLTTLFSAFTLTGWLYLLRTLGLV